MFEERGASGDATRLSEELSGPLRIMQDTARRIAKVIYPTIASSVRVLLLGESYLQVSKEAKLDIDEDKYVQSFVPAMMDIVNAWCKGHSFAQICKVHTTQ